MNNHSAIRSYLKSDRQACLAIFDANCPTYFSPNEREQFVSWLDGQDSGTFTYPNSMADFFYVVLLDFNVIGCGGFYITKDAPVARISWGMIHPDFQHQGYGTKLLMFRMKQIEYLFPNHHMELDTSQHSFPFYEKLEFETKRITHHAYQPGLHRYDMVRYPKVKIK